MKAGQNNKYNITKTSGFIIVKRKWRKELKSIMYHEKVGNENLNKHIGF